MWSPEHPHPHQQCSISKGKHTAFTTVFRNCVLFCFLVKLHELTFIGKINPCHIAEKFLVQDFLCIFLFFLAYRCYQTGLIKPVNLSQEIVFLELLKLETLIFFKHWINMFSLHCLSLSCFVFHARRLVVFL